MANEITIGCSLSVRNGNLQYQSSPTQARADQSVVGGPTPGTITVAVAGTTVTLSALTRPGVCFIHNLDATNYVQLGVYNPDQSEFYPVLRIKPNEAFVFRLDPDVNKEYIGAGTGTTGEQNTLRLKAAVAACRVRVEIFED